MSGRINAKINSLALPVCVRARGEERGRHFAVQLFETHKVSHRASRRVSCLILILRRNLTHAQKHQIIHSDCINRLHSVNHVTFMAFQHNTFAVPLCARVRFFHALRLAVIALQNEMTDDERTNPGLDSSPTFLQDECGVTDWLAGWLTDGLWSDLNRLTFRLGGPERTCHVSWADMETRKRGEE